MSNAGAKAKSQLHVDSRIRRDHNRRMVILGLYDLAGSCPNGNGYFGVFATTNNDDFREGRSDSSRRSVDLLRSGEVSVSSEGTKSESAGAFYAESVQSMKRVAWFVWHGLIPMVALACIMACAMVGISSLILGIAF